MICKAKECDNKITQKVKKFSERQYGLALCRDCQDVFEKMQGSREEKIKAIKEDVEDVEEEVKEEEVSGSQNKSDRENKKDVNINTIKLHGKEYVTHQGLLKKAHKKDVQSIMTKLVNSNPYIFRAVVKMPEDRTFTGYGDATDENVGANIKKHKIRMAETRAINRALRLATGHGKCSIEELSEEDKKED